MSKYDQNVDYKFLDAMAVKHILHQPWQMGLFPEEFEGKFVWYPQKGTLMVEFEKEKYSNRKIGEYFDTEDMYNAMMEVVKKQLSK